MPPPPPHILPLLQQAVTLHQQGDLAGAERLYTKVLAQAPQDFTASHMLGAIRLIQERAAEALALIETALAVEPGSSEALSNRGYALRLLGRYPESLAAIDQSLALSPGAPQALFNRAAVLAEMQRPHEALAAYDDVLTRQPNLLDAINNRANLLRTLRRMEEALAAHNKALALKPRDPLALYNRGVTLRDMNRFQDALASFDKALSIHPDAAQTHYARAHTLWDLNRFAEALDACDRALALTPDFPDALNMRGTILWDMKRGDEALAAYDKVLALAPDHAYARGDRANVVLNLCDWPRIAQIAEQAKTDIPARRTLISPFTLLGYDSSPALQLECARACIQDRIPVRPAPHWTGTPYRHDRIRLAYVSHDFQDHPVATQIAELIERHDRSRFEVSGISIGPDDGGAMRRRLMRGFDAFHDARDMSNRAAADMLRAMEVDILVDLGGHTHGARLEIFSHRPAPVQVSYLGYPGTTGADFLDYVLADPVIVPFDQQPFYSEKIVHLPVSYMPNDATRVIGHTPTRAEMGLPETGFVFCSYNKYYKVSAPVFAVWMRLLHQVPGSVLWLKEDGAPSAQTRMLAAAQEAGIAPGRIIFAGRVAGEVHMARHRLADLFLDSLPYNAHVTACDALWAGLPMVTALGNCFAGRVAGSLLHALNMPELVTQSLEEYEALALALARDPDMLRGIREKLARNLKTAPLFDTPRFVRNMEAAYRIMMDRLERGEAPASFAVEA